MSGYQVEIEPIKSTALLCIRADDDALPVLQSATGMAYPRKARTAAAADGLTVLALSSDEWLLRSAAARESELLDRLRDATSGVHAAVTVVSDHYTGYRLRGDDVLCVLRQGVSLDLSRMHTGEHARLLFARCGALLCCVEYGRCYELFVESSYADYAALWLEVASGRHAGPAP